LCDPISIRGRGAKKFKQDFWVSSARAKTSFFDFSISRDGRMRRFALLGHNSSNRRIVV
jgi:hypothetical protein